MDLAGHQTHYAVQGKAPTTASDGVRGFSGHWRQSISALAARGYRVFAVDLLGFGDSDKPPLAYALELWEQQLHDFCHTLIAQPTIFVGNSIGGLLTLMLLAHYPESARAGVLLNCAGGLNHRPDELNLALRLVMGTFTRLVSSPWLGPLVFNQVRQKRRIRNSLKQVYCSHAAVTDDLVDLIYRPACDPGAQQVFTSVLTAPAGPKPSELLSTIQQPLLVLWGEKDPWTPIQGADIYRQLSESADPPTVTFHSIPETGHCPHDERPDVVNPLIIKWLRQLESAEVMA
ncbi:Hydrolase or acyltransferase of alpha/beta superfamily protein [Halomicronema hongdechloris C2206]|uniref:Hydrolase or acyltransferase of alpha/beta superfamily protein n=1 Tax=Halomicronema hongdechloris C2206 TaxID=1641165 RepID=A0A1Z3HHQ0_9CYAN|nr:alpha/beta fold hydrolase [Halomicronema hongdechloris]ASC69737.1 Hydrolase or acyltransferase of alpha/beta superfamily protein [Halomicronema hongdechloris C2206]